MTKDFERSADALRAHGEISISDCFPRGAEPCRTAMLRRSGPPEHVYGTIKTLCHLVIDHDCIMTAMCVEVDGEPRGVVTVSCSRVLTADEVRAEHGP